MATRNTRGNALSTLQPIKTLAPVDVGAPTRGPLDALPVVPAARDSGPRPTLEMLLRDILREELLPFRRMVFELTQLLGRPANAEQYLSVAGAAALLNVAESSVRSWIQQGRLRAGKTGRLIRIQRTDLDALWAELHRSERPDPEAEAAKILARRPSNR